jgi:pimeloyl-ACP methyl ester carboxylesterase
VLANGRRLLPELTLDRFALADVGVPVLLVWGDRDRMVAPTGGRHVLDALPGTTSVVLDGVGHCPQVEAPDRLLAALQEFLMRQDVALP